jgi:hypothetical protein
MQATALFCVFVLFVVGLAFAQRTLLLECNLNNFHYFIIGFNRQFKLAAGVLGFGSVPISECSTWLPIGLSLTIMLASSFWL